MVNFNDTIENPQFGARFSIISHLSRVIGSFVLEFLNFHYHGNKGQYRVNFSDSIGPRNPLFGAKVLTISSVIQGIANSVLKFPNFH